MRNSFRERGWFTSRIGKAIFAIYWIGRRIDSLEAACLRIDWYRRRWLIEIFFRILKSGCPQLPCDVIFAEEEWQAAWIVAKRQPPPQTAPTLGEMIRIVAGFGGFWGRKGDGHPGPKAIWEGMMKLMAYVEAIQTAREVYRISVGCG